MIGPDHDPSEFHPVAWPRIRTVLEFDAVIAAVVQRRAVDVLPHQTAEAVASTITAAVAQVAGKADLGAQPLDPQRVDDFGYWWWCGVWRWWWKFPPPPPPPRERWHLGDDLNAGPSPWPLTSGLAEAAFVLLELAGAVEKFGSPELAEALAPILKDAAASPTG
ncbi:MAG: hypothetical protein ACRCYX_12285 [Dermatophilaceae bacterium]